jgi:hypothetical protein
MRPTVLFDKLRMSEFAHDELVDALGAKTLAALGTATGKDLAAVGGGHAGTEAVVALALEVAGLVGALGGHGRLGVNGGKDRRF